MSINHTEKVRDHFATAWEEYDQKITNAIPFYKESFDTLIAVVKAAASDPQRILEIGVGTGNLTKNLLHAFPKASLVGIDLVEQYIYQAQQKLSTFEDRIILRVEDINTFAFREYYDLVITSYVFHHIDNSRQHALYETIYAHLNQSGLFINADFVDSSSVYFSQLFDRLRMDDMRRQGVSETAIHTDYVAHREFEMPMPLEQQLTVLSQIGFNDVECFWKYLNLAVFGGRKG